MTNEQLAELIYNMAGETYEPLDLINIVSGWDLEEWSQVDPEPDARRLTLKDRLEIVATLANILAKECEV